MSFMTKYANKPSFEVDSPAKKGSSAQKSFIEETKVDFPKLLVSCGSGVSIIKVDDFNSFKRVSGTMIGGGTLLGLANLLTGENDFDTII